MDANDGRELAHMAEMPWLTLVGDDLTNGAILTCLRHYPKAGEGRFLPVATNLDLAFRLIDRFNNRAMKPFRYEQAEKDILVSLLGQLKSSNVTHVGVDVELNHGKFKTVDEFIEVIQRDL